MSFSITLNARFWPGLDIECMLTLRLFRHLQYAIPLYTVPLYWHQQNRSPIRKPIYTDPPPDHCNDPLTITRITIM